jgi:hypothetical protein
MMQKIVNAAKNMASSLSSEVFGNVRVVFYKQESGEDIPLIMIGPHWFGLLLTVVFVCMGTALNYSIVRDRIEMDRLSFGFGLFLRFLLLPLFFVLTIYYLLLTGLKDPGIVLFQYLEPIDAEALQLMDRNRDDDDERGERDVERVENDDNCTTMAIQGECSHPTTTRRPKGTLNRPMSRNDIYCRPCDMFLQREQEAFHCSQCDLCVAQMDHHCPWIGQCVGGKNFRNFMKFNICWMLYLIELMLVCFAL